MPINNPPSSGGGVTDGQPVFTDGPIFSSTSGGKGLFAAGAVSIGDNSGSLASIDASGNLVAATIISNGNTFASLFDGSAGNVLTAANADGANHANVVSGGTFDTFFASLGLTSSGSSNVFLQTDGDGSGLTGVMAANGIDADTGWTANADSGDKTAVIGSTATLDGIATALNLVTAGAGTQLENIAQKVKALEAALATQLRPNA